MSQYKDILKTQNYIGGQWMAEGEGTLAVFDKYHGATLAALPMGTKSHIDTAIRKAELGFAELRTWSAGRRAQHLEQLAQRLDEKRDAFVDLIVKEAGKPRAYARNEIDRCLLTIRTAAAEAVRHTGETVPIDFAAGEGKTAFTKRFPIGVIGCITPFNFPLNLVLHKVAPALAVGCSVIVKPALQAPLVTLALAGLIDQLDYPAGAFNALVCPNSVAECLVTDPRIAMLSFTGSAAVGWRLKSMAGRKKVTLELGGNAAVIVDDSADLSAAAKTIATGSFIYAGQVCISTQRVFVVESVFDDFVKALRQEISRIQCGDPNSDGVTVGPIIDTTHLHRIRDWVDEAVAGGAKVLCGGSILDEKHNLYAPTLLTDTAPQMRVCREEVFGPVAVVEKVRDFAEAVTRTNDSDFGLQAGVFTNTFAHVKAAHEQLEVGGVMINNVPGFRIDSMPYGGIKGSGFGREGIKYAMDEMTEPRLLVY
ncbi:MAG: aldehyde dehydrogenase family protein [Candidatus Zixiibacteriota bacterium]